MKKIILLLIVTILLTTSCFAVVFNDISGHWAQLSILDVYYNNFVSGYTDGTFKPNNTITRAEFITILSKVLDSSILIDIDGYHDIFTYDDLPESHWCKPFYNKLMYYGSVFSDDSSITPDKGKSFITPILGSSFNPSEPITRAEAVSLIAYFLDDSKLDEENTINLSDIEVSPLRDYINKFCKTGIIKGYSDGTFKPDNTITRAEVTKIISDIFAQKFYFKNIVWINESSIEKVYTTPLIPEDVIAEFLFYETTNQYEFAYQFFSAKYRQNNEIYNYKDYMKKTSSHISSALPILEEDITIELTSKENKDGSATVSFKTPDNKTYSIDLILVGEKWCINSKLY